MSRDAAIQSVTGQAPLLQSDALFPHGVEIVDYHSGIHDEPTDQSHAPGTPGRDPARGFPRSDTAERLARYFGGDAESWMSLQAAYDLKTLPTRDEIRKRVEPRAA